jgi:hypothetical protein
MWNGHRNTFALTLCYRKRSSHCRPSHAPFERTPTDEERYTKLENSGDLQPIIRDPGLGTTRPVLEDDLRHAIESLEASTATIQKQTETLKLQCENLNKQLGRENNVEQQRSRDIARLRKKHEVGRQTTTMAVGNYPPRPTVACC